MFRPLFSLTLALCLAASAAPNWVLKATHGTECSILLGNEQLFKITPDYFKKNWAGGGSITSPVDFESAKLVGISPQAGEEFTSELDVKQLASNVCKLDYVMTSKQDIDLESLYVHWSIPTAYLGNQPYVINGTQHGVFPKEMPQIIHLFRAEVTTLDIMTTKGAFKLVFSEPTHVLCQDDRQWADKFTFRFGPEPDSKHFAQGEAVKVHCTVTFPDEFKTAIDTPVTIVANDDWIPLTTYLDVKKGSALDFSRYGFADGPAGKHGWLKAVGRHFEFEKLPGVNQRFYGVNFVGSAQVISHEKAEQLAERLYRVGYNAVRFHHHENSLILHEKDCTTKLNPKAMDEFDYLFNQLKLRGIYCTTDMYVSRQVLWNELIPDKEGKVSMGDFKWLVPVFRPAMENLKTYSRNFLLHKNPYTGMTYAEDPAMAWLSMINENTPYLGNLSRAKGLVGELWLKAWNDWSMKKYHTAAARNAAWQTDYPETLTAMLPHGFKDTEERDFNIFVEEMYSAMFRELKALIRDECGSKALLTDMNYGTITSWSQNVRTEYDYVDHHFYIDHPRFLNTSWRLPSTCDNQSVVAKGIRTIGGTWSSMARLFDHPFTISEYNYSGPGRYRGIGGILTGCLASVQDWGGLWRFAYSHSNTPIFKVAITNYFDMCRDPLNQAAERASIMLYLRQDMTAADKSIALTLSRDYLNTCKQVPKGDFCPLWNQFAFISQIGTLVGSNSSFCNASVTVPMDDKAPVAGMVIKGINPFDNETFKAIANSVKQQHWLPQGNLTDPEANPMPVQSPNGEITILPADDTMILNTRQTAGGFAPAGTTIKTKSVDITIRDTDATVWTSALDDKAIGNSHHLLINHLTDLCNTDMRFGEAERKTLLSWGQLPHLVRYGRATITIRSSAKSMTLYVLRTDGERLGTVPVTRTANGFTADLCVKGAQGAQMIYEAILE